MDLQGDPEVPIELVIHCNTRFYRITNGLLHETLVYDNEVQPGLHDPRFLPLGDVGACRFETASARHRLVNMKSSVNEGFRRARDIPDVTAQGGRWGRTFTGRPTGMSEQFLRGELT